MCLPFDKAEECPRCGASSRDQGWDYDAQFCHRCPRRVQLSRKKGWRIPPNTVTVARPSTWGNPISVGGCMHVEVDGDMLEAKITPAIAVELYREYIAGALRNHPDLLVPLRGKNLACWCALNQPCHADVLLDLANHP